MNKSENENPNVYEDLFIGYFESLCSFVYSYIPDMEVAKDIVQDTFVSLWKNRDKYELTNTLLYTIAKNKSIDYIKTSHQTNGLKGIPIDIFTNLLQTNQEEDFDSKEIIEKIWEYVETLPAQCKKVFILSRHDNLKNKEIADQLEISVKAVEKQITKALSLIRAHLLKNGISLTITLLLFLK
ncbi:RNA polymerase sigma-70 factor (ECF subfamily) [Dysgonomonas hofstadii]|uniref:RNA polymerase sigma-70 factor (ECF subfamily) n=1 Tax=Dysgonomonas hofstadii TaxID=637886 RepID=A0A840CVJ7_9BACT|nr:RNA polymerase sigma-70 factor [Dysgonomonas hofstadii]MBB4037684.1 RNA polymerase sigma-70 factor (ECF subfamily) [Dysgonomonas hofstadii]